MVDVQNVGADFREASETRHDTYSQMYRFDKNVRSCWPSQKGLSIHNQNPGPRQEKKMDALKKQIEGNWHVITL